MRRKAVWTAGLVAAGAALAAACGGGGGSSPTSPTPNPAPVGGGGSTVTITITASGVSPRSVTVAPGGRVRFVNNNTLAHDMSSDPHPNHTDCPEINQVGFIQPGQSKDTGILNTVRTCGFHDHNQPSNDSLAGSISVR